jgi:hypothetical protein
VTIQLRDGLWGGGTDGPPTPNQIPS